ncbi:hypothetical protein, partial [Thalassospira sp.]|uniref:hypothetical protein n=1 Tax=Thalassospira sp. TaxID=1912094 RepID=UPI003AA94AC6
MLPHSGSDMKTARFPYRKQAALTGNLQLVIRCSGSKLIQMVDPALDRREKARKSPQIGVIP